MNAVTGEIPATEDAVADLLCFDLGLERFALPLTSILEIADGCDVQWLGSAACAVPVLRLREWLIPVQDAAPVLRAPCCCEAPLALVIRARHGLVAVLVDAAEAVPGASLYSLRAPAALMTDDRVLEGVVRVGSRWVRMLMPTPSWTRWHHREFQAPVGDFLADNQLSHSAAQAYGVRGRAAAAAIAAAVDRATLVTFTIGKDTLACPVENVERVLQFTPPAPVPCMPDWLEGVIEHRGVVVPVIDLRGRFSRERVANSSATRLVIFNVQSDWLAAVVDAVSEVVTVDAFTIVPPPPLVRGLSGAYLLGMVTHRDQVVPVLDIGKVLSASEVLVLEALQETIQHAHND